MGLVADILLDKYKRRQLRKSQNKATARTAFTGTSPTDDEIDQYVSGDFGLDNSQYVNSSRATELFDAIKTNSAETEDLGRSFAIKEGGLDSKDLAQRLRERLLNKAAPALTSAQQANAANKLDVSPGKMVAGALFDRFRTSGGILDETEALKEQARKFIEDSKLNRAKTGIEETRGNALTKVIDNLFGEGADPTLIADIANQRAVRKDPEKIKIRGADGQDEYVFANRNIKGGFDVVQPDVKLPAPKNVTTTERKNKSNETLWRDSVTAAEKRMGRRATPQKLHDAALQSYRAKLNDQLAEPPSSVKQESGTLQGGREQARGRAEQDGFTNLGEWVEGKGFEVFDENGAVIGHYL